MRRHAQPGRCGEQYLRTAEGGPRAFQIHPVGLMEEVPRGMFLLVHLGLTVWGLGTKRKSSHQQRVGPEPAESREDPKGGLREPWIPPQGEPHRSLQLTSALGFLEWLSHGFPRSLPCQEYERGGALHKGCGIQTAEPGHWGTASGQAIDHAGGRRGNSPPEQMWASRTFTPLPLSAQRDTRQGCPTESTLMWLGWWASGR